MKDVLLFYPEGSSVVNGRFKLSDGKWHPQTTGCRTMAEAKKAVPGIIDELYKKHGLERPGGKVAEPDNKVSFRVCLEDARDKWIERQKHRSSKNYDSALNHLWEVFGEKAQQDTKSQKPVTFAKLREHLIASGLSKRTIQLYAKLIRELLQKLVKHGLNPECIEELENIRPQGKSEAAGEAFHRPQLREILERVGQSSNTNQGLTWIGIAGGPQIVDAVFLKIESVKFDTGLVSGERVKTDERFEFGALPPLVEWFKQRKESLGPGAVYFFPELIFTEEEAKSPECNKSAWKKVPQQVAARGSANGMKVINEFLMACGLKTKEVTYKSFRKGNISFWASIGIKLKTRMRMAGHTREDSHNRYDTPWREEILSARDITWKYLQAVQKDEPFFIPTGPYDIYHALIKHWDGLPDIMCAAIHTELNGSFVALQQEMQKHAIEQNKLIKSLEATFVLNFNDSRTSHEWVRLSLQAIMNHFRIPMPGVGNNRSEPLNINPDQMQLN
jgi:hypothetical protein